MTGSATTDTIAVTVHGPSGALDLLVPVGAAVADVAREYAAHCGLPHPPELVTPAGRLLPGVGRPRVGRPRVGRRAGRRRSVRRPPRCPPSRDRSGQPHGGPASPGSAPRCGARSRRSRASSPACSPPAPTTPSDRPRSCCCCSPRRAASCRPAGSPPQRAAAAPAFAAAAAFAAAWQPGADRLPLLVGIAGLGAAAAAGATRAAGASGREVQNVWIASGIGVFLVPGGTLLAGFAPQVAWGVMVVLALLAARSVPAYAVDVPDQMLIDLEKLAVTAWSARDRTTGRRGRMIIPEAGVRELLPAAPRSSTPRASPSSPSSWWPSPACSPRRRWTSTGLGAAAPGVLRRRRAAAGRPQLSPRAGPLAAADLRALRVDGAGRHPAPGRARAHPVVRRRRGAGARRGGAAWRRWRPGGAGGRCGGRAVPRSASRCAGRSRWPRSSSRPGCSVTCGS